MQPRPYVEIAAERKAAILANAPLIPKGACHMCNWRQYGKELFCSSACAQDFHAEVKELRG